MINAICIKTPSSAYELQDGRELTKSKNENIIINWYCIDNIMLLVVKDLKPTLLLEVVFSAFVKIINNIAVSWMKWPGAPINISNFIR